jgi:hypothetical protein
MEPVRKTGCGERRTIFRDQKRQMRGWRFFEHLSKLGMHRHRKQRARFLLPKLDHAIADMLRPEPDNVAPALRCEQCQRERQACPRADPMLRLELRDVLLAPGAEAFEAV